MLPKSGIGVALSLILANTLALADGPGSRSVQSSTLSRLGPVGGWNPDGRGIFHWWDGDCFSSPRTPDDYCRKPLPRLHCLPRPVVVDQAHTHSWSHACPTCNRAR